MGAYPSVQGVTLPIPVPSGGSAIANAANTDTTLLSNPAGKSIHTGNGGNDIVLDFGNVAIGAGSNKFDGSAAGTVAITPRLKSVVANEAAAASAGAGAAPPATVQGYLIVKDSGGTDRKIPYYNV